MAPLPPSEAAPAPPQAAAAAPRAFCWRSNACFFVRACVSRSGDTAGVGRETEKIGLCKEVRLEKIRRCVKKKERLASSPCAP